MSWQMDSTAKQMEITSSKRVVYVAFIGNLLVAATKFIAAHWTGSSAMLSEAMHPLADTGNQIPLLYGLRRASALLDREHPLGHRRELYFWSFIVALLVFPLGAGGASIVLERRARHRHRYGPPD